MSQLKDLFPSNDISPALSEFKAQIEHEFIEGSAIAPVLFQAAVRIISDLEVLPGGDISTPIHDALGWRYTRFGQQANEGLHGAFLQNEEGSFWQAKLSRPRVDRKKTTANLRTLLNRSIHEFEFWSLVQQHPDQTVFQKYETPVGNGSRAYLPPIPLEIRQRISDRYKTRVPQTGSFWAWLEHHPEVPIIFTEGGKKALALLSLGYVAIALYGVNGGYSKLLDGSRKLTADVERFTISGRLVTLAFDQDAKLSTQYRVNVALSRFGALLQQAECEVAIASWDGKQGKGVDDLIVSCGAQAWESAYINTLSLLHWQLWQRLEGRLTLSAKLRLNTADLSTLKLARLPETGIIGIASGKGTGKTKLLAGAIANVEKALAAGHRVALMRNLSSRLGLDYRGDLDKTPDGRFTNGSAYSLRIGFCVDALLAINPEHFKGCDLILDEAVQVVRHLLTSSTCAKDGKRPVLLARFRELVGVARRVIAADADLDNATLRYLQELRGEIFPPWLLRNDYQNEGYPVRFLQVSDRTVITQRLLSELRELPTGKTIFVATDSKNTSKVLARLFSQECPEKRVLLVNSETSGGEAEREFMEAPDLVLQRGDFDLILSSPSVATGVSIEARGIIHKVYGIFTGASSTDADMAQALMRVREPIERIVWCAIAGSNFSKVSRSTNPLELKSHLQQKTSTTISLIRSGLREDITQAIGSYDWQNNPHLNLFSKLTADQNFSMRHLRDALLIRLKFEGHSITIENADSDPATKLLLRTIAEERRQFDAETLMAVEDLTFAEVVAIEQKENPTPEERLAISKFYLRDFYGLETLTLDDILWDNEGKRRGEILNLEAQLYPGVAVERSVKSLEKQAKWNQTHCPWDISHAELRRKLRSAIGLDELIDRILNGWQWTKYDLAPYAAKARALAPQIKVVLHFSISDRVSDVQIMHQLLLQLGIPIAEPHWSRFMPGHEGEKLRVYQLNQNEWSRLSAILTRRQMKRLQHSADPSEKGSPSQKLKINNQGDPELSVLMNIEQWLSPEALADVRFYWAATEGDADRIQKVKRFIPEFVLRYLGFVA